MNTIRSIYITLFEWLNIVFKPLAMLGLRWQLFLVFFYSGLAKWNGFLKPDPGVYDLFLYEFFCPEEPRAGALQLCDPKTLEGAELFGRAQVIAFCTNVVHCASRNVDQVGGSGGRLHQP